MEFVGGASKGFAGPAELGAPNDLEQVIVDFIERATQTVDVAVQELGSVPIAGALIRQRVAGRSAQGVPNHDELQDRRSKEDPLAGGPATVAELAARPLPGAGDGRDASRGGPIIAQTPGGAPARPR